MPLNYKMPETLEKFVQLDKRTFINEMGILSIII